MKEEEEEEQGEGEGGRGGREGEGERGVGRRRKERKEKRIGKKYALLISPLHFYLKNVLKWFVLHRITLEAVVQEC